MSSTKYEVKKFCGKGKFSLWQRRMKDLLIQQGVHKALLGKAKKPKKMSDENWEEMDEKAANAIRLNLGDEVIHNILEAKTAEQIWKKLEGLYMRKNLTNKLYVKKQIYSLQTKDDSDLLEHLNAFNMLITKLTNFGVNLEEEDKAILLLASLPTSFNHLVTTLMYGKDTLELKEVTSALLSHSKMKQDGDDSQGDGLVVHSKSNHSRNKSRGSNSNKERSQSRSRAKKDVECFYCHKTGHYKKSVQRVETTPRGEEE
jgi:hypothetical protein